MQLADFLSPEIMSISLKRTSTLYNTAIGFLQSTSSVSEAVWLIPFHVYCLSPPQESEYLKAGTFSSSLCPKSLDLAWQQRKLSIGHPWKPGLLWWANPVFPSRLWLEAKDWVWLFLVPSTCSPARHINLPNKPWISWLLWPSGGILLRHICLWIASDSMLKSCRSHLCPTCFIQATLHICSWFLSGLSPW